MQDNLTGLADRCQFAIAFKSSVDRNIKQCRDFSLMVIKLEGLSFINRQHGQPSADLALTCFATLLSGCISYRDQVFCYGDEQFTVLLSDTKQGAAQVISASIQQAVSMNLLLAEFNLCCCIGSADYQKNDELETLFRKASIGLEKQTMSNKYD